MATRVRVHRGTGGDVHEGAWLFQGSTRAFISVCPTPAVYESGLLMGRLGRRRGFLVRPKNATLKNADRFSGITVLEYDPNRSDGNMIAALGPG